MKIVSILVLPAILSMASLPETCLDDAGQPLYQPSCCCTAGWCGPVPDSAVQETADGWVLTIRSGEHRRLVPGRYEINRDRASPSPDGRWHACGFTAVNCFLYVPGVS